MGKVLFTLLALLFAFQIFRLKGIKKLPWFFAGILFFPPSIQIVEKPNMPFPRFIIYTLLISILFQEKRLLKQIKAFPLKRSLLLLFVLLLAIGLFDDRLDYFLRIYRPINYFIDNFSPLLLLFIATKRVEDITSNYRTLIKFLVIFGLYGIINYLTKHNEYNNLINQIYGGRDVANDNMASGVSRFRVASFTWQAIYYGFLLSIVLFIELFLYKVERLKHRRKVIYGCYFALFLVNLVLTNSRTPLLTFIAGFLLFALFSFNLSQKLRLFFAGGILLFVAFLFIPSFNDLASNSIDTFTNGGAKVEGSSVEMREAQLAASFVVFYKKPITGNGFGYIIEDLGFAADRDDRKSDKDFQGFESYSYKLLIEQGTCGIVGNFILFFGIIGFFRKKYKKSNLFGKQLAILSISMFIAFLLFIFGTGDLGSFTILMSIIGMNIKGVLLSKKTKTPNNFNNETTYGLTPPI